jgi:dTMP kinase
MSAETGSSGGTLEGQIREAERRLEEAATLAAEIERRAEAEIRALEADLERERARNSQIAEELRLGHEEELEREREAKDRAIAEAEARLGEIEAQVEAAEKRVEVAEGRAATVEATVGDQLARARESAAAWLREQLDSLRREAEGR